MMLACLLLALAQDDNAADAALSNGPEGRVRIDGTPATKPGVALRPGMRLAVEIPEPVPDAPRPEEIPIEVVYEDEHLAVVEKPAGLVVHRGHGV